MVAASYLVCDNCASVLHPRCPEKCATLLLAVPEWPSDGGCTSLDQSGRKSMIRLCLVCCRNHFRIYPELIPFEVQGRYLSKKEIKAKYSPGNKTIESIKDRSCWGEPPFCGAIQAAKFGSWCSEREALEKARLFFGGDVGIRVYEENPHVTNGPFVIEMKETKEPKKEIRVYLLFPKNLVTVFARSSCPSRSRPRKPSQTMIRSRSPMHS